MNCSRVALRPIGATESRAAESNRGAGHDDHANGGQSGDADRSIAGRRHRRRIVGASFAFSAASGDGYGHARAHELRRLPHPPGRRARSPTPSTADINHYDRYFFNGYDPRRLARTSRVAHGPLPEPPRGRRGVQRRARRRAAAVSVFASRRAPDRPRRRHDVGPIRVEVVEPLHACALHVDAAGARACAADLTFTRRVGTRSRSRTSSSGSACARCSTTPGSPSSVSWNGWIEVDGERVEFVAAPSRGDRATARGASVRSANRRRAARPLADAAVLLAVGAGQLRQRCRPTSTSNEYGDGRRWHEVGVIAPGDGDRGPRCGPSTTASTWRPGTRWAASFEYDLVFVGRGSCHDRLASSRCSTSTCSASATAIPEWTHGIVDG